MNADDIRRYFVEKPVYEVVAAEMTKGRQHPSMTLMSRALVADCNNYVECGWIFAMPDPNPSIHEHVHDHDEIVVHLGTDPDNPEDLGAEIDFYLDGQPLTITKTSAIFVPRGIKHGPLIWKRVDRPHMEMAIMLGAGTLNESDPGGHLKNM